VTIRQGYYHLDTLGLISADPDDPNRATRATGLV
jgi:hypothetical protein